MKLFYFFFIFFIFNQCSFDNKTGIWKNDNTVTKNNKNDNVFKEFVKISTSEEIFNEIIDLNENFNFRLPSPIKNFQWKDIYYDQTNNYKNFKYNNLNQTVFKSKKLTKYSINNFILFEKNNLILSDHKGNIVIFGIDKNEIISKFNFYKKNYKKIKKNLNFIVDENIIYVADNLGYLYAYNYIIDKVLWAKNYKIPFRSNIKILNNKIMVSNQNNSLFFFNKKNGDLLKLIPTEETIIKNQFINNLSTDSLNTLFFLNSYGSLYSFNIETMKVNWFLNLNQTLELNPSNLFFGNQIVNNKNKIIISSNKNTYIIDIKTGSILNKKNFSSLIKPIIQNDYVFFITKNNLIISMNLNSGKIIYSYDINQQISDFLNTKKKYVQFKDFILANNEIIIFLKNSYILNYKINGKLKDVKKLPSKINSQPIFINSSLLFLNKKNKILILD